MNTGFAFMFILTSNMKKSFRILFKTSSLLGIFLCALWVDRGAGHSEEGGQRREAKTGGRTWSRYESIWTLGKRRSWCTTQRQHWKSNQYDLFSMILSPVSYETCDYRNDVFVCVCV